MTCKTPFRMALMSATFLGFAGHAFALDGQDVLTKINAAFAAQAGKVTADAVEVDGSDITLKNVSFTPTGGEASPKIGDVTLEGVEEDGEGGYSIETISFPDINVTNDGATLTADEIYLSGVSVPADATADSIYSVALYDSAHLGNLTVKEGGRDVFSLGEIAASMTVHDDEQGLDFDFAVKDIKADLGTVEDAKSKEAIEKLGLAALDGSITMKGSWQLGPGTIAAETLAFDFANIGKLDLSFSISGYTMKLVRSLQETIKAAEANPNKEQAQQAAGLAAMGIMQQLTFNSASIRFEDGSITKRALDYAGAEQGISGADLAQSLKGMVPLMVAQLNVPDLQNAISTAVTAYLDNPKSLTVKATPPSPVAVPMIMGAAMGAPNTLPQVLGVQVTAND